MARKSKYTKALLQPLVGEVKSIAELTRRLGLKISGGTHRYIKAKLELHNIDTSHFTGQLWSKGQKLGENFYRTQRPLQEILVVNSDYSSSKLKHRLIKAGLKQNYCDNCGLVVWNGKVLPLELHHLNEKPNDNRLENLQILCPNCHAVVDKPEQL